MSTAPISHTVMIRVRVLDQDRLVQSGREYFIDNGGDEASPRTLSEHIVECLMFGGSPVNDGFEIESILALEW